jgi:signal transduction histidine kinase
MCRRLNAALDRQDVVSIQQDIREVSEQIGQLKALVRLTQNMLSWFFALADENVGRKRSSEFTPEEQSEDPTGLTQSDSGEVLNVADILRDIEEPVSTLADLRRRLTIAWNYPSSPLFVAAASDLPRSTSEADLIAAVLFKFLDNAIKKTEKDDITVTCVPGLSQAHKPIVIFRITNSGEPIDEFDRQMLFKLRFRPGKRGGSSSGIGLYQAWVIAKRIDGDVGYEADGAGHNVFWLSLPAAGN